MMKDMIMTMNNTIPIFSTDGSMGKSILTADAASSVEEYPVSVFSIAKTYNLKSLFVRDNHFINFISLYKNAKKIGIPLRYGIKFPIFNTPDENGDKYESLSYITIFMLNSDGYYDLIKIYSQAFSEKDFRGLRWENLGDIKSKNILISFDFYNSFIYFNSFENKKVIPLIPKNIPVRFEISSCGLPFDDLILKRVKRFCEENNYQTINTHPIFYFKKEDFIACLNYRLCGQREHKKTDAFNKPEMEHFSSNEFSFETFYERTQAQAQ